MSALVLAPALFFVSADAALKIPYLDSLQRDFYVESCKSKLSVAVKNPACKVAPRLDAFIVWVDSVGGAHTNEEYGKAVKDRYVSLNGTQRYAADIKGWPLIGVASAPLTVVMYFSGTCPLCKANFVELEREVVSGSLKGKARIVAKPFGENVVNKALVAAHDLGRFSDFMHALAVEKRRVDEDVLYEIASSLYFDREHFKSVVGSQSVGDRVVASHKEGKKNGVELVPTYFIGGRRYESVSTPKWIVDAIDYVFTADGKVVGGVKSADVKDKAGN